MFLCVMGISPIHYELEFEPDFDNFTFRGRARVTVACSEATSEIAMDAAELNVLSCNVIIGDNRLPVRTRVDVSAENLLISLDREICGKCIVDVQYTGLLNDRLLGFYRSSYKYDGQTKYLATTQFEAADARRAFPCWDAPQYKATFQVAILAPENMSAISNMPVAHTSNEGDLTRYVFETTPIMSTYLLYLGVGEFEYLDGDDGIIRVVTTLGKSHLGRYALEMTRLLLPEFENYFGISYPLPKLDIIALPDFAAGAMENWGAITFRERLLLYDEENSSTRTKQLIAEVLSHELAHQWFGNLVTMKWWNDLWLNESFATFMATKILDRLHPEWSLWDQFIDESVNSAMQMDALHSTHPIDVRVDSPSQIREIFDAISYDKGGCVLRMLEDYVGYGTFQNGLRAYLEKFEYGNAAGADLWECIEDVLGSPVRSMVETWLAQDGFPVLSATLQENVVSLRQERFRMDGRRDDASLWQVPLKFLDGEKVRTHMITDKTAALDVQHGFVCNHNRAGFYRVEYDSSLYGDIKSMIKRRVLSAYDSWGVQNDMFAFCLQGRVSIRRYLDVVSAYSPDDAYLPLADVCRNVTVLLGMSHGQSWHNLVAESVGPLLGGLLEMLRWQPSPKDPHTHAFLRGMVIKGLGQMDDDTVVSRCRNLTASFQDSPESVHPDIRESAFWVAAGHGDMSLHSEMKEMYMESQSIEEKLRILSGMCGFSTPDLVHKTLDFALSGEVRSQDMQVPVLRTAANPGGYGILWPWLHQHWHEMESKIGHGNPIFSRIIYGMAPALTGPQSVAAGKFFESHPVPGTERTVSQTLETVSVFEKFRARAAKECDD